MQNITTANLPINTDSVCLKQIVLVNCKTYFKVDILRSVKFQPSGML